MSAPQIGIDVTVNKMSELKICVGKHFEDRASVEVAEIQNSDLASQRCHIGYDVAGPCLSYREIIFKYVEVFCHLNKSPDRKGIVLG